MSKTKSEKCRLGVPLHYIYLVLQCRYSVLAVYQIFSLVQMYLWVKLFLCWYKMYMHVFLVTSERHYCDIIQEGVEIVIIIPIKASSVRMMH